jgi:hypothetical protein
MTWFARVWIVSALFVGIVAVAVSAGEAQDDGGAAQLPPGFELIPVDARAAVVIPSLKRASDDMTQLLDGMERAEMLVGLRPIDQLRALLGLTAAVREAGPALVIVPAGQERMPPLYLIPVMDAEDFLETSFDPAPGGPANAYLHPTGRTIYARSLEQHVALCEDPAVVESYQPAGGLDQALAARIGDRALQLMRRGEIILYADAGMLSEIAAAEQEGFPGVPMLGDFAPPLDLLDAVDASITSLDFDPLGLGVHGVVLLNEENPLGAASGGEPRAESALSHLPAKPFYVAGAIDLRAFGGLDMVSALTAGLIEAPEWVSTIRGIEFAASPSPLGLQGGMLNEAVIHLACDDSKGALEFLRGEVLGRAGTTDARTVAPKWEVAKREIEGISVDAFEIAVTETPPDPIRQLLRTTMFGRRGINGFVGAVEDGLILTFSQRPDVYAAAIKARREGPSLADDPVLAEMRTWLPPDCDFEMYVALGQFSRMINQFAGVFGLGAGTIPEIDPATHPIALAADHQNGTIETGLVIPADVLALIFDTLAERWMAAEEAMTGN